MDFDEFSFKVNELVTSIKTINGGALDFLNKCIRAYSSKAHLWNNFNDLRLVSRFSPPPQNILDFGCGIGIQSYLLSEMGYKVTGLETVFDKSLEGFLKKRARVHIETRENSMTTVWRLIRDQSSDIIFDVYDGIRLPYKDNSFDIVFAYAVIEHIPKKDVPAMIKEIGRVLKSGGIFYIFQLPQRYSYTEFLARTLNIESHEFLWSFREITDILKPAGLEIIYTARADMFFNHPYRLINPFFSLIKFINKFFLQTPLSYFCHHLTIVARNKK